MKWTTSYIQDHQGGAGTCFGCPRRLNGVPQDYSRDLSTTPIPMTMTESELKDYMRRVNSELWSEGNLDFIEDYVAEDYVEHNTAAPEPIRGPDGYRENVEMVRTAFPDLEVNTEDLIVEGNRVVTRYTLTGTHEGPLMGIEPTGNEVEFEGISIGRFEDGKVVEGWSNIDVFGMMQQLGVVEGAGPE